MTSQTGQQISTIHMLPISPEVKGNEIWPVDRMQRQKYFS